MNDREDQSKTTPRSVAHSRARRSKKAQRTDATMQDRPSAVRTYRLDEFLRLPGPPPPFNGQRWGGWSLDIEHRTLEYIPEGYVISLDWCADSAEMMDRIFQVFGKGWADAQMMYDLLKAFEEIFHPQKNLCSNGAGKRISPAEFLPQRFGQTERKS